MQRIRCFITIVRIARTINHNTQPSSVQKPLFGQGYIGVYVFSIVERYRRMAIARLLFDHRSFMAYRTSVTSLSDQRLPAGISLSLRVYTYRYTSSPQSICFTLDIQSGYINRVPISFLRFLNLNAHLFQFQLCETMLRCS